MHNPALDALIIENIADLDAACQRMYYEIQQNISDEIDKVIERFVNENNWKTQGSVNYNWNQDEDSPWIAPIEWKSKDKDKFQYRFSIERGENDTGGYEINEHAFWLTRLLGIGTGVFGLRWKHEHKIRKWKEFIKNNKKDTIMKIIKIGFQYEEDRGQFFFSVKINQSELVSAVKDGDFESVLEVLSIALKVLEDSKVHFDSLIKGANSIE